MADERRLDPDALAALEEERAFLLRSLEDLDAELAAGDLEPDDYEELRDGYTHRAAEVIRSIEQRQAAFAAQPGVRGRQILVWLVGLALLGGLSGALIARSSGARSGGESITGGVRSSVVSRLNQAQNLLGDQERWDDAIEIYDEVLVDDPSSAEAVTYRAWLRYRQGGPVDEAVDAFEEAGRLDPDYPDAIVFETIVLSDAERWEHAAATLDRLDLATAPAPIRSLLDQRGLVGSVYGEATYDQLVGSPEPTLAELGLSVDGALAAAGYLLGTEKDGRSVAALKLYAAIQEVEPDNTAALSRSATLLALTGSPSVFERAKELVERAVAAAPDDPEALLSRATVLLVTTGAATRSCADLDAIAALAEVPEAIAAQAETLRSASCP